MRKSENLLAALAAALLLTGCVQTTTVSNIAESNADDSDAAELNYQLGARYLRNGNYELARDRLLLSIELKSRAGTIRPAKQPSMMRHDAIRA